MKRKNVRKSMRNIDIRAKQSFAISEVASHVPRLADIAVHCGLDFATRRRSVEMDSSPWPQRQSGPSARTEGLRLGATRKLSF